MASLKRFKVCAAVLVSGLFVIIANPGIIQAAQAGAARDFGVGAILGEPTGLSLKYWLSNITALDGAVAWKFAHDESRLQIHADHLWHIDIHDAHITQGRLPFYLGVGLRVESGPHPNAGVRIPLGLAFLFNAAPIELFSEIVPVVRFAPDSGSDLEGGVGVRYYFK